jgi:cytochrome oxidase Cu insertion factor (SCO1/SenC/PrrC family)
VVGALTFAAALAVATFVPALQPGDTVPAIPLVDQSGDAFSLTQLRGNAVVLSFIYTRCADPQMCPLTSSKFARLQQLIGSSPIRLLEVTLDPAFDTPRVLRAYGRAFGERPRTWTLATGEPSAIGAFAQRLSVATQWTKPGTLVHTESVIVLDRYGRIAQIIDGNAWAPADVLADANALVTADAPSVVSRIRLWLGAAVESCGGGALGVSALVMLALLAAVIGTVSVVLFRSLRI